jgi:membrane protease YdiL (CAAX protease family)
MRRRKNINENILARHATSFFFATCLVFSALIAYLSNTLGNENISLLIPLSPSLIAILIAILGSGRSGLKEMLKGRTLARLDLRWSLVALLLIPIVALTGLLAHSFFGGPQLGLRTTQLLPQVIVILLISLGEEYGWRGFALPRLQKHLSALNASLVLGVIWGIWHYPGFLIGVGVPLDMPFTVFLVWTVLAAVLMTWVYNNTGGSVLSAILMHSAANATFNYLPVLPEFVGQMTTFSVFLGLLALVVVLVVSRHGPKTLVRR